MKIIDGEEKAALMQDISERIVRDTQKIGAPERTAVWDAGWREVLEAYRANPDVALLVPKFIRNDRPVRFWQEFGWPESDEERELAHVRKMQDRIAEVMQDCPQIAEFGAGTCHNLVALGRRFKRTLLHALDFSPAAVELAELIRPTQNMNIYGQRFDMRSPPEGSRALQGGFGVFTFGAIEQLAGEFRPFMEFLIDQRPRIVVHVEPTIELYDRENPVDELAVRFHLKRGYTTGLLPWLQANVDVLHVERTYYGSLMHEGYSIIMWRPRA